MENERQSGIAEEVDKDLISAIASTFQDRISPSPHGLREIVNGKVVR